MAEKKEYIIRVQNQLVPVNEEVYFAYYQMKRRENYLEERDIKNGLFHYSSLDTEETNGEDAIQDNISAHVEDVVVDKLIKEKLHKCISMLSKEEQNLIFSIYFEGKTQTELEAETGVKQQTISYREFQIRKKLKKMLEN